MHEKAEAARLCFLVSIWGKCKLASILPAVQETAYLGLILKHSVIKGIALDMNLAYFILHRAVCPVQHREAQEADFAAFVPYCVKSPKTFMRFNAKIRTKFVDFYTNICYTMFSVYSGRTEHV